jgi:alginate export protein
MTGLACSGLLVAVLGVGNAVAQTDCPTSPPGYELLRQDEDYRYLRNQACRNDFWDRVKFVPLRSNADAFLTIGGEIREWYEGYRNASWGLGPQDPNGYLFQRLSMYSDLHATSRIRLFAEITSDIEAGRVGGPRPVTDESRLFFEEAFADITLSKGRRAQLALRLGRQEFELGAGRLVDVREGPNVRQTFDGASLHLLASSWNVIGFALKPVLNGTGVWDAPPEHGATFWGVYATRAVRAIKGAKIDVYYLGLARKDAMFDIGSANELRHTAGGRFSGSRGGWRYDSEAAFQWGSFGTRNIRAWGTGHDTSYTFRSVRLQPQIGTSALVASGSHGSSQADLGTLNPLFPTGYYFGQGGVSLLGPSNLTAVGPKLILRFTKAVTFVADNNVFWRTSLQDGVYGLGVRVLVSGRDNTRRYVGNQPSVALHVSASRHLSVSAAYAHFSIGPFLREASPPGRNVDYAAVWTTYKF